MMVARDGVERFCVVCFQQLTDSTKDTEDRKDTFCVRFFLRTLPIEIGQTQIRSKNPFRCSRRPMKTMEIIKNACVIRTVPRVHSQQERGSSSRSDICAESLSRLPAGNRDHNHLRSAAAPVARWHQHEHRADQQLPWFWRRHEPAIHVVRGTCDGTRRSPFVEVFFDRLAAANGFVSAAVIPCGMEAII